ncbi:hypothetical protein [Pseudomonas sp. O230]|uniref:hypothetical protein n=1 Tax=Pseudomonas sp. O230 TaxID=3159450 RepID=UPI00387B90DB
MMSAKVFSPEPSDVGSVNTSTRTIAKTITKILRTLSFSLKKNDERVNIAAGARPLKTSVSREAQQEGVLVHSM